MVFMILRRKCESSVENGGVERLTETLELDSINSSRARKSLEIVLDLTF
jgi:hypothetical protein